VLFSFSFMHHATVGVRCKYSECACAQMLQAALFVADCCDFIVHEFGAQIILGACICVSECFVMYCTLTSCLRNLAA
jgi:hypothetical protein